jgi:hypothetical protein
MRAVDLAAFYAALPMKVCTQHRICSSIEINCSVIYRHDTKSQRQFSAPPLDCPVMLFPDRTRLARSGPFAKPLAAARNRLAKPYPSTNPTDQRN